MTPSLAPAIVIVCLIASACAADAPGGSPQTPAPTREALTSPPAAERASPTATATEEPTPSPSPTATSPRALSPGVVAEVVAEDLTFRSSASTSGTPVEGRESLQPGDLLFVVEGPVSADGFDWYRAVPSLDAPDPRTSEIGWVAARPSGSDDAYVVPADIRCPDEPVTVSDLMSIEALGAVACFGDGDLVFRAWVTETTGLGGYCGCDASPEWLAHPFAAFVALDDEETAYIVDGDGRWFSAYIDRDAVQQPEVGQWVEVAGHFDDPAAEACEWTETDPGFGPFDPTLVVVHCRARFVAAGFERVAGP